MQEQYNRDYQDNDGSGFGRGVAVTLISFLMILTTGAGVYYWQNNQANTEKDQLLSRIENLEAGDTESSSGEVNSLIDSAKKTSYKSRVGNLEIVLPDSYAYVVRVDGRFGNSERSIIRIAEKIGTNIYRDVLDDFIEVEITKSDKTAEEELKDYHATLDKSGYKLDKQYEIKFSNYEGYLTTGKSDFAQLRTYFVKRGNYAYKFAQTMPLDEPNEDNQHLLTVLNSITIGD